MGISTGQITSALSTQNRTLSPITSQRCQLIRSNCPSSHAGHSHRQLITEELRHFTSVGSCGTTYWSVTVLHVAPQWSNTLHVRRFDLCQGWESFHLMLLSQFQVSSSCFSVTAANKVFWSILYKALTISRMSRFNKSAGCQSYLSYFVSKNWSVHDDENVRRVYMPVLICVYSLSICVQISVPGADWEYLPLFTNWLQIQTNISKWTPFVQQYLALLAFKKC